MDQPVHQGVVMKKQVLHIQEEPEQEGTRLMVVAALCGFLIEVEVGHRRPYASRIYLLKIFPSLLFLLHHRLYGRDATIVSCINLWCVFQVFVVLGIVNFPCICAISCKI